MKKLLWALLALILCSQGALADAVPPELLRGYQESYGSRSVPDDYLEFHLPEGAFYFFPKSPVPDENIFIEALVKEKVLAVSGSGFGMPGYVRFSFCVPEKVILNAAPGIAAAVKACREKC